MDEQAYGQSTPLASCIFLQHKLKIGEGVSSAVFSRTDPCTCAHFDTEPCTCAHFDRGGNIEGGPINGACSQHLPRDGRTPQRTPQAHRRAHISISIYHSSQTLSATQSAQDAGTGCKHQAQDASIRHQPALPGRVYQHTQPARGTAMRRLSAIVPPADAVAPSYARALKGRYAR